MGFTSDGGRLVTRASASGSGPINVRALPEGRLERSLEVSPPDAAVVLVDGDCVLTFAFDTSAPEGEQPALIRRLSLDGSTQEVIGRWEPHGLTGFSLDPGGTTILSMQQGHLVEQRLDALSSTPRVLGTHEGSYVRMRPWRDRAATGDASGEVRIWDVFRARLEHTLKSSEDARWIALDPRGRFIATAPRSVFIPPRSIFLFDLAAPPTAEPVPLVCPEATLITQMGFSPDGSWLASEHPDVAVLWNTSGKRTTVLGRQKPPNVNVAFTRDNRLLSGSEDGTLKRWPLDPAAREGVRDFWTGSGSKPKKEVEGLGAILGEGIYICQVDPEGRFVVAANNYGEILVAPLDGSPPTVHQLRQPSEARIAEGTLTTMAPGSLDAGGRFLAVWAPWLRKPELNRIRILDLATGDVRLLDTRAKGEEGCHNELLGGTDMWTGLGVPVWLRDGRLVSDGDAGLRVWDLSTGASRLLRPCTKNSAPGLLLATPDSRMIVRVDAALAVTPSALSVFDLASGTTREIITHGNRLCWLTLDPSGTIIVTGDRNGVVRAGRITGEEPHLLFGNTSPVAGVAVSPDGRWIASSTEDGTIRLWPMPDITKPPLHTLLHDELVAKLRSLTNLRAVRDSASDTGWKIEIGPFPGWQDAPTW